MLAMYYMYRYSGKVLCGVSVLSAGPYVGCFTSSRRRPKSSNPYAQKKKKERSKNLFNIKTVRRRRR